MCKKTWQLNGRSVTNSTIHEILNEGSFVIYSLCNSVDLHSRPKLSKIHTLIDNLSV